jgi:hypothetical protein
MNIKWWFIAVVCMCGSMCLASDVAEPALPPQFDEPADFDGTVQEKLAKHEQYLASIRYTVAIQLKHIAKEDDVGAALAKSIEYISSKVTGTTSNSLAFGALLQIGPAVENELRQAERERKQISDGDDQYPLADAAVKSCEAVKARYDQAKGGYFGLNKQLVEIRGKLSSALRLWGKGGNEKRPAFAKDLLQRYRDWCVWTGK